MPVQFKEARRSSHSIWSDFEIAELYYGSEITSQGFSFKDGSVIKDYISICVAKFGRTNIHANEKVKLLPDWQQLNGFKTSYLLFKRFCCQCLMTVERSSKK